MIRGILLELLDLFRFARRALGGPCCRFSPSCTGYAREAIERLPLPKAGLLIALRVLRCHPFHPGGWDPVPADTIPIPRVAALTAPRPAP